MINEWAGDLWTVPQMSGFSLVRPLLTMQESLVEIAGDVVYLPGGSPSMAEEGTATTMDTMHP
jgi:hypothetical protein